MGFEANATSELTLKTHYNPVEKIVYENAKQFDQTITSGFGEEMVLRDTLSCLYVENIELSGYTGICTVEAWPAAGDSVDFLLTVKANISLSFDGSGRVEEIEFKYLDSEIFHQD